MKYFLIWFSLLSALLLLGGCGGAQSDNADSEIELTLFVAASLTDVIKEVGDVYEKNEEVKLVYNFAGSGALAQQLIAAPRADLFFSASEHWMNEVEEAGVIAPATRHALLSNRLVVVANKHSDFAITSLDELLSLDFQYIAVGDPAFVPVGQYAKDWLENEKTPEGQSLWDRLEGRLSPAPDTRAAMGQVLGSSRLIGIVYRTDYLARQDELKLLYETAPGETAQIQYPVAVIKNSEHFEEAQSFFDFLETEQARSLLEAHGFITHDSK